MMTLYEQIQLLFDNKLYTNISALVKLTPFRIDVDIRVNENIDELIHLYCR